jgi:hypothetical protein
MKDKLSSFDAALKQIYSAQNISSLMSNHPFFGIKRYTDGACMCLICHADLVQTIDADLRRYSNSFHWVTHDHADCDAMVVEQIMES